MDLSFLLKLIDADKIGGWVRAGVAAGFVYLAHRYAPLAAYLTPENEAAVDTIAVTVIVGIWSQIAKNLSASSASSASAASAQNLAKLLLVAPVLAKIAAVLALGLGLAACTKAELDAFVAKAKQDVAAMEAQVASFIAKAKQDAPIVLADAKAVAGVACNLVQISQAGLQTLQSSVSGVSDKTQASIDKVSGYLGKGQAACDKYSSTLAAAPLPSADPTSDAINTTIAAWNAYIAAKGTSLTAVKSVSGN